MVLTLVAIAVLVVLGVLALAASKPDRFSLSRETEVDAAPERLFSLINDFHEWQQWSPWEKLDPNLRRVYGGANNGKGAVYEWQGNKKVGEGRMEILDASTDAIRIKLDFLKPFEAHNVAEFLLEPRNGGTHVKWTMGGPLPFPMKVMHVFMNMDKMVGKDFEAGLANLKRVAESS